MSAGESARSSLPPSAWDERRAMLARLVAGELGAKGIEALEGVGDDEAVAREFGIQLAIDAMLRYQTGAIGLTARFSRRLPGHRTPRARALRVGWIAAAAAAVLVGAGIALRSGPGGAPPELAAVVEAVRGGVRAAGRAVAAGDAIRHGQEVRTADAGFVALRYDDGTTLSVLGDSALTLAKEAGARCLVASQGVFEARVRPLLAGLPLVVRTPHAEVRASDSAFAVVVAPGHTRVEVDRGALAVRAAAGGQAVSVAAGTCAEAKPGAAVALGPMPSEAARRALRIPGLVALYDLTRAPDGAAEDTSGAGIAPRLVASGPGGPVCGPDGWRMEYPQGASTEGTAAALAAHLAATKAFTIEVCLTTLSLPEAPVPTMPVLYVAPGAAQGAPAQWLGIVTDDEDRASIGRDGRITVTYTCVLDEKVEVTEYKNGEKGHGPKRFTLRLARDGIRVGIMGRGMRDPRAAWAARFELLTIYDRVLSTEEIRRGIAAADR